MSADVIGGGDVLDCMGLASPGQLGFYDRLGLIQRWCSGVNPGSLARIRGDGVNPSLFPCPWVVSPGGRFPSQQERLLGLDGGNTEQEHCYYAS